MKRHRHTPEQALMKIREGERLLNEGQSIVEVLRHIDVTEATFNRWCVQYGGMKADEAKRLKTLEVENQRLKKLEAEQALDIDMLKEWSRGPFDPGTWVSRHVSVGGEGVPVRSPGAMRVRGWPFL